MPALSLPGPSALGTSISSSSGADSIFHADDASTGVSTLPATEMWYPSTMTTSLSTLLGSQASMTSVIPRPVALSTNPTHTILSATPTLLKVPNTAMTLTPVAKKGGKGGGSKGSSSGGGGGGFGAAEYVELVGQSILGLLCVAGIVTSIVEKVKKCNARRRARREIANPRPAAAVAGANVSHPVRPARPRPVLSTVRRST